MSVPSYITYIQNLNDEDLAEIVKDLIGLRMTGYIKKDSKFRDYVSVVKDFFKDFESPQTSPDLIAEKVVKDEVFKRYVKIYDAQSKTLVSDDIKTPYTNADKIRSMTDEELAELLERCEGEGYQDSSITPTNEYGYHMDMLEWLKQPVEEER